MSGVPGGGVTLRAHVASLVAVFLALALGIAVGGIALHATQVHDLQTRTTSAEGAAAAASSSAANAGAALGRADSVSVAATGQLLGTRLKGRDVLVLTLPGAAAGDRDRLLASLTGAGATVGGDLRLGRAAVAGDGDQLLLDVAMRLDPGVHGTAAHRFATVLAEAGTAASSAPSPAPSPASGTPGTADLAARLVPALQAANLLDAGSRTDGRADAVVIVAPTAAGADPAEAGTDALALELSRTARTRVAAVVLAGPVAAAGQGGAVAALRGDPLRSTVSTVDGLDGAAGPALTSLALATAAHVGHYGTGPGATSPLPTT